MHAFFKGNKHEVKGKKSELSSIWTRVAIFIFCDDNCYAKHASSRGAHSQQILFSRVITRQKQMSKFYVNCSIYLSLYP